MHLCKSICIVDDDILMLEYYTSLLQDDGYNVLTFNNPSLLFEYLQQSALPDLILLDLFLGDYNGMEVLTELKQHPIYCSISVVLFSGMAGLYTTSQNALQLGADGLIHRPIENKEFLLRINEYLKHQSIHHELRRTKLSFQSLLENNPDAILVIDDSAVVLYSNRAGYRFLNICEQDICRYHLRINPQSAEKQIITVGRSDNRPAFGEVVCTPISWEGTPAYLAVVHDKSEHFELEEKLKQSNRIFQHAVDMLCIAGFDGYFKAVNPSFTRILGWSEEEILARPWISLVHPDDVELTLNIGNEINDGINIRAFENRYFCKDGTIKWISWNAYVYQEEQVIFAVARDITVKKLTEKSLQQSEETFRRLFYNHHAYQFILDPETLRIVAVNDSALSFYGYSKEEFEHLSIADINVLPVQKLRNFVGLLLDKKHKAFEFKHKLKDGSTRDVEAQACIITVGGKEMIHAIIRDISENKKTQAMLGLFNKVIEQNIAAIVITDNLGFIRYVNPKFSEITGYLYDELEGKTLSILKSGAQPEEYYREMWNTILSGKVFSDEFINKKKNGELYNSQTVISPILDRSGKITDFVGISEDITEQRRMASEMQRTQQRFRSVWDNAMESMRLTDINGVIIDVNPSFSRMFGLGPNDIKGKYFTSLYHHSYNFCIEDYTELFKDRKIAPYMEKQIVLWNGEKKWFAVSNAFIKDELHDNLLLSIFSDITETKELIKELMAARDKAQEMSRVKSYFFANMSHELRTPFIGIMGYAEMLSEIASEPEVLKAANHILQSSERLNKTLNKILSLSKLEFKIPELQMTTVKIELLAEEIYRLFAKPAAQKNLQLLLDINPKQISFVTEEAFLREILENLVSNAVKFTAAGHVTIFVQEQNNQFPKGLIIKVTDSGIGIPAEKQEIIWQEFRQASEGFNRAYEGTGLGLTLIGRYCELLKGTISVSSEVGRGSEFTLFLPASHAESTAHNAVNNSHGLKELIHQSDQSSLWAGKRLLYVEDDDTAAELMKIIFRNKLHIDIASSAEIALDMIAVQPYHILLVDINLGFRMNGLEFVRRILAHKEYENCPIIAVTAYASDEQRAEFLANGFTHYLAKPFFKQDILSLVTNAFKENPIISR